MGNFSQLHLHEVLHLIKLVLQDVVSVSQENLLISFLLSHPLLPLFMRLRTS